jgi:hypothetical protein
MGFSIVLMIIQRILHNCGVFLRNGRAFLRTRERGVVYLIRCPQSRDVDLRGGEIRNHNYNEM